MSEKKTKLFRSPWSKERDFTAEREERCLPIVSKILLLIGNLPRLPVGTIDHKQVNSIYKELNIKVHDILVEAGDIDIEEDYAYIFKSINQVVFMVNEIVGNSIKRNYSDLNFAVFGMDPKEGDRLTINQLAKLVARKDQIGDATAVILSEPAEGERIKMPTI